MEFDINKQLVDHRVNQIMNLKMDVFDGLREEKKKSTAFLLYGVSSFLDMEIDVAANYLTDGGNDGGFDAAYYERNEDNELNVFLFQAKYRRDFSKNYTVATKNIRDAIATVISVFDPEKRLQLNPQSKGVVDEIHSYIYEGLVPKVTFVLLFNGDGWDDEGAQLIKNAFGNNDQVQFKLYNHNDMIKKLDKTRKISAQLRLSGTSTKEDYNYKSVIVGKMRISEIHDLIAGYGNSLLEKNVRKYLGINKVNLQIRDTLLDGEKNANFFFYNNGVTFICNKMSANYLQKNDWVVNTDGLQIINGGQTCQTIYETLEEFPDKDYTDSFVLVRIYEVAEDEKLIYDITYATNNQNPIDFRDLKANDSIQISLEKGAALLGAEYKRKKDDRIGGIPSQVAAEAVLTIWRRQPFAAKNKKGDLFTAYYDTIFKYLNAAQMIIAVKIYRFCDSMRKKDGASLEINISRRFSNYILAMVIGDQTLKRMHITLQELTHNNYEQVNAWLDRNLPDLYLESETLILGIVKEQLKSVLWKDQPDLSRVDGRTIASLYRNQSLVEAYFNLTKEVPHL